MMKRNQGMPQWVKEYVVMIIAGILLLVFAGRMFAAEKIKEPQNRRKEDYCSALLLFRQNFYAVICDKYHVFDLG